MRFALPLATALLTLPALAQSDAPQHQYSSTDRAAAGTMLGQVKVEDDNDPFVPNAFIGSFRMEMHRLKDGKEAPEGPMDMHYWSSPDMNLISMASEKAKQGAATDLKVLTDLKGKWTYMLMTDPRGTKTAMKSRKKKYIMDTTEQSGHQPGKFTVTNETKIIDGHKCTKVVSTTEEGTWTGWVAKDIAIPFGDIANNMTRGAMQRNRQNWDGLGGFPLEFEMADKSGNKTMQVFVKDLQVGAVDPGIFSITDYKVMEIPGIQRAAGE